MKFNMDGEKTREQITLDLLEGLIGDYAVAITWTTETNGMHVFSTTLDTVKARSLGEALGQTIIKNWKLEDGKNRGSIHSYVVKLIE